MGYRLVASIYTFSTGVQQVRQDASKLNSTRVINSVVNCQTNKQPRELGNKKCQSTSPLMLKFSSCSRDLIFVHVTKLTLVQCILQFIKNFV